MRCRFSDLTCWAGRLSSPPITELRVLAEKNPTSARLRGWALILSEFDFKVTYVSGANHAGVDCFSRHLSSEEIDSYLDNCVYAVAMPLDPEEWAEEYYDSESQRLFADADSGGDLEIVNNSLYRAGKLYVSPCRRETLLRQAHASPRGGHGGVKATLAKLQAVWWPGIHRDVTRPVSSCLECQARKVESIVPLEPISAVRNKCSVATRSRGHSGSFPAQYRGIGTWSYWLMFSPALWTPSR